MSDTVSNNASPATEVTKEAGRVKLPFKEMVSYSFTDMAGNLLYVTLSSYIMYFYTDVFGISASGALGAATILLVARFADAISAVVWGSPVPPVVPVARGPVRGDGVHRVHGTVLAE
ncbi:MFS transporter [Bifidobacterium bifidum]|uniref:MFS transporter n=1 Tax=Bifidobacterium bifidum TaxID=1681 RepID=UPI0023D92F01|nr:MFS transporter [Bifidobacterium bifidum]